MGIWDQFDDEEDGEEAEAEDAAPDPNDVSEEDGVFNDAMALAESVKGGWGARTQLEACLAVAEAALLSKAAKVQQIGRAHV